MLPESCYTDSSFNPTTMSWYCQTHHATNKINIQRTKPTKTKLTTVSPLIWHVICVCIALFDFVCLFILIVLIFLLLPYVWWNKLYIWCVCSVTTAWSMDTLALLRRTSHNGALYKSIYLSFPFFVQETVPRGTSYCWLNVYVLPFHLAVYADYIESCCLYVFIMNTWYSRWQRKRCAEASTEHQQLEDIRRPELAGKEQS